MYYISYKEIKVWYNFKTIKKTLLNYTVPLCPRGTKPSSPSSLVRCWMTEAPLLRRRVGAAGAGARGGLTRTGGYRKEI
jgi:hypothetical protein